MRDRAEFEAWTKDKYRAPGWKRLEKIEREGAASDWKFFIWWLNLYGYEDAVAMKKRVRAKVEEGERKRQSPFEAGG